MVELEQLRYVRLPANDLGRAADFARRVLGLEPIDRTEELATFRSDFRDYTLAFMSGQHALQAIGLEVRYSSDLDAAIEALRRAGQADQLQLQRLKKRKLLLRDKLARLEDQVTPDIIA